MVDKLDCFLLAAGESSRMFPLSTIMEKSLLPIDGKPVIRYIVDQLIKLTDDYIELITICCLDKFKKQFEHEFRDLGEEVVKIEGFPKPAGTYTTWFRSAVKEFTTDYSMVHYADCFTEINYRDFISTALRLKKDGLIAVTNSVKHDYSQVIFDGGKESPYNNPRVILFEEKPPLPYCTWSGIGIFNTINLRKFYNGHTGQDFAKNIFNKMTENEQLNAYLYDGYWYDVGNLNSYRKLCALYNNGTNGNI